MVNGECEENDGDVSSVTIGTPMDEINAYLVVRSVKPITFQSKKRNGLPKRTTLLDPVRDRVSRKIHVRRLDKNKSFHL